MENCNNFLRFNCKCKKKGIEVKKAFPSLINYLGKFKFDSGDLLFVCFSSNNEFRSIFDICYAKVLKVSWHNNPAYNRLSI